MSLGSKQYKLAHGNRGFKKLGKMAERVGVLSLGSKQYKLAHGDRGFKKLGKMAERVGFEPTVHCCTQTFEIRTLSHSDTSPYLQQVLL